MDELPRATVVGAPPRRAALWLAIAIVAIGAALAWRMVETERRGQLMSAASAATRSTE